MLQVRVCLTATLGYFDLGCAAPAMQKYRCSVCMLPSFTDLEEVSRFPNQTCRTCYDSLVESKRDLAADLKARQARRRELKPLLADLLRKHAANRAEIAKKILTFVGFDLPE